MAGLVVNNQKLIIDLYLDIQITEQCHDIVFPNLINLEFNSKTQQIYNS